MAVEGGREISVLQHQKSAPEISENGELGQERELQLELVDVGLVGFPSSQQVNIA